MSCSSELLWPPASTRITGETAASAVPWHELPRSLESWGGAQGRVALVNRRGGGFHRSIPDAAADGAIDLAILCVPAPACPDLIDEAAEAGVGAVMVCSGGFAEVGGSAIELQERLAERAIAAGVRLLGPNTSGFIDPRRDLTATFVPGVAAIPAGRIAVVAASGGVNHALAFLLAEAGHGLSLGVGLGNAVDVDALSLWIPERAWYALLGFR